MCFFQLAQASQWRFTSYAETGQQASSSIGGMILI